MQILRGLDELGGNQQRSVVSVGNFDGVHLGPSDGAAVDGGACA